MNENEIEFLEMEPEEFRMTRKEVIYFLNSIKHEYLNKDTYYDTMNLIQRMRAYLKDESS